MTRESLAISRYLPPMRRGPALSEAEAERVRGALTSLVSRYPSQKACADATGLGQQSINKILNKRITPGHHFARELAKALGIGADELLGSGVASPRPALATLPGWPAASAAAARENPHLTEQIHALGQVGVPHPVHLTADWIANMAHHYWQGIKPEKK